MDNVSIAPQPANKQRKPFIRFGIKTIMVVMTIACLVFLILGNSIGEAHRQKIMLSRAKAIGAEISFAGLIKRKKTLSDRILETSGWHDSWQHRYHRINFSGQALDNQTLATITNFSHVRDLDLSGTQITNASLADLKGISDLQRLDLSDTNITDLGMPYLKKMTNLRRLDLSGTKVTDSGIKQLLGLPHLQSLNIEKTEITFTALEMLEDYFPLSRFCEEHANKILQNTPGIFLTSNTSQEVDSIIELPNFSPYSSTIKTIAASIHNGSQSSGATPYWGSALTDEKIEIISHLESLESLYLVGGSITGTKRLAPLIRLKNLRNLGLNSVTDQDLESISRQTQLETLAIFSTAITNKGLESLYSLTNLKTLELQYSNLITEQGIRDLKNALPNCKVNLLITQSATSTE